MTARLIDGKAIAAAIRERLAIEVVAFHKSTNRFPKLAAILVGDDAASQVYVRNKEQACAKAGIASEVHRLDANTTQAELLQRVAQLNADPSVNGILVQLPLPPQIHETTILDSITPLKDVDCFHPENVGRLAQGRPRVLPCTPHGVQQVLRLSGICVDGANVVVLGRSEIVGKPISLMLAQKGETANATVTICHSRTKNLADFTRRADILIGRSNRLGNHPCSRRDWADDDRDAIGKHAERGKTANLKRSKTAGPNFSGVETLKFRSVATFLEDDKLRLILYSVEM